MNEMKTFAFPCYASIFIHSWIKQEGNGSIATTFWFPSFFSFFSSCFLLT